MSIQPIFLALLILLTTGVSSAQDGKSTPLKGLTSWQGTLDVGAAKLRLKFEIQSQDDTLKTRIFSIDQGNAEIPASKTKLLGDDITIEAKSIGAKFEGTLNYPARTITGKWTQGANTFDLTLKKLDRQHPAKKQARKRPQTPSKPYPYEESTVRFENSDNSATLAGNLTLPKGKGPFPAAILISGSGPHDRDGLMFEHKPFLVIADHLTRQGIAVLRYDDRGVGRSKGNLNDLTSADFAKDARAGFDFLKQHPKINHSEIGFIGHSEGGLIAPMIAAKHSDVAFLVLLAGPGVDGGIVLQSQFREMAKIRGASEEYLLAQDRWLNALLKVIRQNDPATLSQLQSAGAATLKSISNKTVLETLQRASTNLTPQLATQWFQFFVRHAPTEALKEVTCPVLVLNGEKDTQVLPDLNLSGIDKALKDSGHKDFALKPLPNLNHLFQETEGRGLPEEYLTIEQTFSPLALNEITNWLKQQTK